jgi:hypothetical protein
MSSRWVCGGGSQLSKTKSNSDSFSFNLPADILLIVHEFLPASSQLCLLTTCRGIKVLLEHRTVPYSRLTLEQKREYKTFVIRQFPNAWLAEDTLRFREFQEEDLHPQPQGPPFGGQPGWKSNDLARFRAGALLIRHRHVRMSLIYHRLEKKTRRQKSFLKSLLEPYHTDFSPCLQIHPSEKSGAVGHFESHPKLISGRYLLFNQWTFTNTLRGGTIALPKLGGFGACTHQGMSDFGWKAFLSRRKRYAEFGFRRETIQLARALWLLPPGRRSEEFFECVCEAIKNPGRQVDGMCPYCLTEFSICMTTKMMQMRVWRDLGTEDSCWSPVWQTHLGVSHPQGLPRGKDCLEIRSRYGDTGIEGQ